IAIIVVGHDSARHLPALFAALPAAIAPARPALCLVDNASRDETAILFEAFARTWPGPAIVHRASANLGYTGGNDVALARLAEQGPFDAYVLLNPDAVPCPG